MHEYITEHWIVLKGKAQVEINGKTSYLFRIKVPTYLLSQNIESPIMKVILLF